MKPPSESKFNGSFEDKMELFLALSSLKTPEEMHKFLSQLLTDSELQMVQTRWLIGKLLMQGNTARAISRRLNIGTDTVMRFKKRLQKNGDLLRKWLLR